MTYHPDTASAIVNREIAGRLTIVRVMHNKIHEVLDQLNTQYDYLLVLCQSGKAYLVGELDLCVSIAGSFAISSGNTLSLPGGAPYPVWCYQGIPHHKLEEFIKTNMPGGGFAA